LNRRRLSGIFILGCFFAIVACGSQVETAQPSAPNVPSIPITSALPDQTTTAGSAVDSGDSTASASVSALPGLSVDSVQALMTSQLPTGGSLDSSFSDATQMSYLWPGSGVVNIGTGSGGELTGVSCEDDANFSAPLSDPFLQLCIELPYIGADALAVQQWMSEQIPLHLDTYSVVYAQIAGQRWQLDFAPSPYEAVYLTVGFANGPPGV